MSGMGLVTQMGMVIGMVAGINRKVEMRRGIGIVQCSMQGLDPSNALPSSEFSTALSSPCNLHGNVFRCCLHEVGDHDDQERNGYMNVEKTKHGYVDRDGAMN